MSRLFIAEKPSVGRELAAALGAKSANTHAGFVETPDGIVTWCIGHMLESLDPEEYDPSLKKWTFETLPIIPKPFRHAPKAASADQLKVLKRLISKSSEVVIATDPDREGELIGRLLLEHCGYSGIVKRLKLREIRANSIRKEIAERMLDGSETEPLAAAGLARSVSDWVVGYNLTRAVSLVIGGDGPTSVGRVQTPTMAMVVRRDLEIKNFKSVPYFEISADVSADGHEVELRHAPPVEKRYLDQRVAEEIAERAKASSGNVSVSTEPGRKAPPKLFDLGGLQKECDRLFGMSAKATLDVAQALYDQLKVTSYPRTDSTYLPDEKSQDVPVIVANLSGVPELAGFYKAGFDKEPVIRRTVFDSKKVPNHWAIIPVCSEQGHAVDMSVFNGRKSGDLERKVFLLIAQRYLAALSPDHEYDETRIEYRVGEDVLFKATGRVPTAYGWKDVAADDGDEEKDAPAKLPPIKDGADATVVSAKVESKKTKPPAAYTEATLLTDMENAAKFCEDPKLKEILNRDDEGKPKGMGAPSSRADCIAKICNVGFIKKEGRKLVATPKAHDTFKLLASKFPRLLDPGETAQWELQLSAIAEGEDPSPFTTEIEEFTKSAVELLRGEQKAAPATSGGGAKASGDRPEGSPTGKVDPKTKSEIFDYGTYWHSKGGAFLQKKLFNREMSLDEYLSVLSAPKGKEPAFNGFVSAKTQRAFGATLVAVQVKKDGKAYWNIEPKFN